MFWYVVIDFGIVSANKYGILKHYWYVPFAGLAALPLIYGIIFYKYEIATIGTTIFLIILTAVSINAQKQQTKFIEDQTKFDTAPFVILGLNEKDFLYFPFENDKPVLFVKIENVSKAPALYLIVRAEYHSIVNDKPNFKVSAYDSFNNIFMPDSKDCKEIRLIEFKSEHCGGCSNCGILDIYAFYMSISGQWYKTTIQYKTPLLTASSDGKDPDGKFFEKYLWDDAFMKVEETSIEEIRAIYGRGGLTVSLDVIKYFEDRNEKKVRKKS
jgi:hypothetical protein